MIIFKKKKKNVTPKIHLLSQRIRKVKDKYIINLILKRRIFVIIVAKKVTNIRNAH